MKTKTAWCALFFIGVHKLPAQSIRYTPVQPYISLSAYSSKQPDPLSFTGNQAALAPVKSAGAGIAGERRFMLNETSVYTLGACLPTKLGNVAIQLNYAGFKNFNENKIGLAYARKLGKLLDVGVQFNYYAYRIPAYGSTSAINFEMGALLRLTEKLKAGIHIYNPVGGKLGKTSDEKLAAVYKFGLGYDASDKFFIGSEIIKEEDKAVNVIAGLHYQFARQFFVKAGFISESASVYAGAGVAWKIFRLDIFSCYHPLLGFSPALLLVINGKQKTE